MQLKFYIKVEDFVRHFMKFKGYVDEGKQSKASMEEIKVMVEEIVVF